MRRKELASSLFVLVMLMVCLGTLTVGIACSGKHAINAPVPNQQNQFDGESYRIISDAQAAIDSIKSDISTHQLTMTGTQVAWFNQFVHDYNVAQDAWQAQHAGVGGDATALTNAVSQLYKDMGQLTTNFPKH